MKLRSEVRRVFARLKDRGTPALVAGVLYGTDMRLLEALRLRVKDIDFAKHEIEIGSASSVRAIEGSRHAGVGGRGVVRHGYAVARGAPVARQGHRLCEA